MSISIVPPTRADITAVHALESRAFPVPWRREFFEAELENPGRFNLVARRDGDSGIAGYVFAMWLYDEMHVNKIAVDEQLRRQGIARTLMNRCIEFAIGKGITSISLEVRTSNDDAQAFYRSLAFEPSYIRKRYYPDGESAVVMTKRL